MNTEAARAPHAAALGHAARVICGIDASRTDPHVVAQACELAGADGHIDMVCVIDEEGVGATAQINIERTRAEEALDRARLLARDHGIAATMRIVDDPTPSAALIREAEDHDALVVGTHGTSRAGGIMIGSVATTAVHRARLPVLVARPRSDDVLRRSILLASDGSVHSDAACGLAVSLAAPEASVTVATIGAPPDEEHRYRLAKQTAELTERTGREPVIVTREGSPADLLVELAAELASTLLVVGSGGKRRMRALGSVSERVAHHARCSVLVARPGRG